MAREGRDRQAARRRDRAVLAPLTLFAGLLLVVSAVKLVPALLEQARATSSTPVRRELTADHLIGLAPGQRLCLPRVPLDRDSRVAQLFVRGVPAPGSKLRVTTTAPGHRAEGAVTLSPRSEKVHRPEVEAPLSSAPPRSLIGTVCVENAGGQPVELIGSADPRALTRATAVLDGVPLREAFALRLLAAHERSTLARTPELIDRAAALSPFGPWAFWALVPLLVLGVPLLVGAALAAALRVPDASAPGSATGGLEDR